MPHRKRLRRLHDPVTQGLITPAIATHRQKGGAYIGDGLDRWPAADGLDVARLYQLAIEKAEPGAKYHAVAEEDVPMRAIAEAVGRRLNLPARSIPPEEAQNYFGWLAMFAGYDMLAFSAQAARMGTDRTRTGHRSRTASPVRSLTHALLIGRTRPPGGQ